MVSIVATVNMGVAIVPTVGISMTIAMSIISMSIGIRVAVGEAMDGGDYRVVSIGMSITISKMAIVSISLRLSHSSGFSISRPLAIVVSMSISIRVAVGEAMDGGDYRVVSIGMSMSITISQMSIVGISLRLS